MSRPWKNKFLPFVALAVLFLAGCGGDQRAYWEKADPPIPAPDFQAPLLSGGQTRLADYRGKIVVMEFWATWCGVCRQTMPSLEKIHRRYQDRDVQFLLVNLGEEPEKVKKFLKSKYQTPVVLDSTQMIARRYNVTGIPALFIIDGQGKLRFAKNGYNGGLEKELPKALDALIAERTAQPPQEATNG